MWSIPEQVCSSQYSIRELVEMNVCTSERQEGQGNSGGKLGEGHFQNSVWSDKRDWTLEDDLNLYKMEFRQNLKRENDKV